MILSNSSLLHERYSIQSVLGEVGPFDVNYLAWDLKEEKEVVVREYYPVRLAKRANDGNLLEVHDAGLFEYGLGAYSAEGLLLTRIQSNYVAGCQEQFKQNGTVYCVNNFISGASLSAYLKQQKGRLSEEDALYIIEKVMQALHACHERKLYHGGVSPKSILIGASGEPILLGFQTARFQVARETESLGDIFKPGYSAPEQTTCEIEEGPWWDVYGTAATLFRMLSGQDLPAATDGWSSSKVKVALYRDALLSSEMCDVLAAALSFDKSDRPATIMEFRDMLMLTQKKVTQQLHEGDGAPQYEVGYQVEHTKQEAVWQNGVDVKAAKYIIEAEAPSIRMPQIEASEIEEHDMANVVQTNKPRMLQASAGQEVQREEPRQHQSSGREQELEVLLTKMVKWQQVFVAFILGIVVIALLGLIGGIFYGPAMFRQQESTMPPVAEGAVLPQSVAPALAAATATPDNIEGVLVVDTANQSDIEIIPSPGTTATDNDNGGAARQLLAQVDENPEDVVLDTSTPAVAAPEVLPVKEDTESNNNKPSESAAPNSARASTIENNTSEEEPPAAIATEAADKTVLEDALLSNSDLGILIETPYIEGENEVKGSEKESLHTYYRVQADSLMNQGFVTAALQWYKNALKYSADDTYLNQQIEAITASLDAEARAEVVKDSLAMRLEQVRDQKGIFLLPDTPVTIVDETGLRNSIKYPISAKNAGVSGRVILRYVVDELGQIQDVVVVKGVGWGAEDVVIDLLRKAQFQPATFNGEKVIAWATFTTVFRMGN